ncbi:hypothetical protein SELMODRAFT_423400 [Selaginella moellendorffii]|uniref:Uncharacterized protein n=1 Tax=Selaginella moellendorffii TaxID=88036 RepID=D8SLK8_SELML|nr:hypothetical protein SELMODRAFT_423400 [Selaginella moellendorffii]
MPYASISQLQSVRTIAHLSYLHVDVRSDCVTDLNGQYGAIARGDAAIYLRFPPRDTGDHTAGSIVVGGRTIWKRLAVKDSFPHEMARLQTPTKMFESRVHGAAAIEEKMYVVGGCCRDRYLNDVLLRRSLHALDLRSNQWELIKSSGVIPPALSFHAAVHEGNHLYVFGAGSIRTGSRKGIQIKVLPSCLPHVLQLQSLKTSAMLLVVLRKKPLNMESLKWTVVRAEPRLATESMSLVHTRIKGRGALIASGGNPFILLKTYEVISGAAASDGQAPDAGEQALKIIDRLWTKVGNGGVLVCEVRLMALGSCQLVLAAAKIEVIRGEGWLEPRAEIESQAFAGWNSRRQGDTMEYLVEGAKVGDLVILEHMPHPQAVVITDLKDEWHFAWMDRPRMYVCKAWSRSQGLGILCDLCHDYNLDVVAKVCEDTGER